MIIQLDTLNQRKEPFTEYHSTEIIANLKKSILDHINMPVRYAEDAVKPMVKIKVCSDDANKRLQL